MLYCRLHFKKELQVNFLFTQWKWTYTLDFEPWRWNALNMGFVEKWPSRMQWQWFFGSRVGRAEAFGRSRKSWFLCGAAAPARIYLPPKARSLAGVGYRPPSICLWWSTRNRIWAVKLTQPVCTGLWAFSSRDIVILGRITQWLEGDYE